MLLLIILLSLLVINSFVFIRFRSPLLGFGELLLSICVLINSLALVIGEIFFTDDGVNLPFFVALLLVFILTSAHLILSYLYRTLFFGVVLLPTSLFLFISSITFEIGELTSYTRAHIFFIILFLLAFLVSSSASVLLLLKNSLIKKHSQTQLVSLIPAIETLRKILIGSFFLSYVFLLLSTVFILKDIDWHALHGKSMVSLFIMSFQTLIAIDFYFHRTKFIRLAKQSFVLFVCLIVSYPFFS